MENFGGPRCRRGAHGAPAPPVVNVGAAPCGRPRAAEGGGPYRQQQPGISVGRVWCARSLPPSFASQMPPPSSEGGFLRGVLSLAPSDEGRFPLSGGNVERSETKGVGITGPYETGIIAGGPHPPRCARHLPLKGKALRGAPLQPSPSGEGGTAEGRDG